MMLLGLPFTSGVIKEYSLLLNVKASNKDAVASKDN